ncbi:Hypothetical predicted protein [Paramuricea clavata]|uniref:Uncharacterized protein n=1 Tax=Paramuricea clavata TaxID=317549 RepID=A0A6S7ITW0_PARCT|nr:Hypothetical predicted protein [Paramuricea clavata]
MLNRAQNAALIGQLLIWITGYLCNTKLDTHVCAITHEMFGLVQEDTYSHNDSAPARIVRDNKDEEPLISVFEKHHVFSPTSHPECHFSIATKDFATVEIQQSLLGAKDMRQKQVKDFVQQRLTEPLQQQPNNEQGDTKVQFTDTMHQEQFSYFRFVVSSGFSDGEEAKSSNQLVDPSILCADHEESDTRLVVHDIVNSCDTVVVSARDTDVLFLLVAHLPSMPSANVWMMAGTAVRRKFFAKPGRNGLEGRKRRRQ